MALPSWWSQARHTPGCANGGRLDVDVADWTALAADVAANGGLMLSLWATPAAAALPAHVHAAYLVDGGVLIADLDVGDGTATYPGLESCFPVAGRLQRAAADLAGIRSTATDQRPWIRHAAWRAGEAPLCALPTLVPAQDVPLDDYAFVRVAGDGVHEIAVGPVHAGIIEPGHFRFSVVGEKVLRLEQRLGYVHKGIARRIAELPAREAHRIAARSSGDSAAAYSWAYCQAYEALAGASVPTRGQWLRGACLELERLQNHLGDLGALGNDAGFAFGLAQFSRLKEELCRAIEAAFGVRYLLDVIAPGGVATDVADGAAAHLRDEVCRIVGRVRELHRIYDDHAGVRDRFAGAGTVSPELARRLGLLGLAARASAQVLDLRIDLPCAPYHVLAPRIAVRREGDVAARVAVRFEEVEESGRLLAALLGDLPPGPARSDVADAGPGAAIGLVEGWRGPVFVALETLPGGRIRRCHLHDPSWQAWPALEHAIIGNIVPDFPLINKSFNLSYSGHDG